MIYCSSRPRVQYDCTGNSNVWFFSSSNSSPLEETCVPETRSILTQQNKLWKKSYLALSHVTQNSNQSVCWICFGVFEPWRRKDVRFYRRTKSKSKFLLSRCRQFFPCAFVLKSHTHAQTHAHVRSLKAVEVDRFEVRTISQFALIVLAH